MELNLTGFEAAIKTFLDNYAKEDPAFAKTYGKPNKSVAECCKYIIQEVDKNRKGAKAVACTDEEVFGLAIHYYDEDDIVVEGPRSKVEVVVPQAKPNKKAVSEEPAKAETEPKAEAVVEAKAEPTKPKRSRKKSAPAEDPDMPESIEIPLF